MRLSIACICLFSAPASADLRPSDLKPGSLNGVEGEFRRALDLMPSDPLGAARMLDSLRPRYVLLEDYVLYHAARAYFAGKRYDLAAARASRVSGNSLLDTEARLMHADALIEAGQPGEARAVWRYYLAKYPDGQRRAEINFNLGNFRAAYVLGTLSPWEERAKPRVDMKSMGPEDHIERAEILARAQHHQSAYDEFSKALALNPTPEVECIARYGRAQTMWYQRDRRRAAPLFEEAALTCARAKDVDRHTKALYQHGRCLHNIGKPEEAASKFALVQQAKHTYADDGRFREALAWLDSGDQERAEDLLQDLPERFPDGDMKQEAIWRLAQLKYFQRNYTEALRHLDRALQMGRDKTYYSEGRTHYWRGRVLEHLGKSMAARDSYETAIREYPLSYYSLWAFRRMQASYPVRAEVLERELLDPIPESPPELVFADRPVFKTEPFRRGLALWRLGRSTAARREWASVGIKPGGDDQEMMWLLAALLDRHGYVSESHDMARRILTGYRASWPHGANAARWYIAYPRGYQKILSREAGLARVPEALLYGIVREESGFTPDVVSFAHAYGLTQMIIPTARRFAPRGRRVTAERLKDPSFNARIGSRFLASQMHRYQYSSPLAAAAYNAGEGAVNRWIREHPSIQLDEFVELIGYSQTRKYTQGVIASYFAYSVLYPKRRDLRIPQLYFDLVREPKPKKPRATSVTHPPLTL